MEKRIARTRIGSVVPCENVDPHTGPYLDYGVITAWVTHNGMPCPRKGATHAIIEMSGRKFAEWGSWAEAHAYKLDPFGEMGRRE